MPDQKHSLKDLPPSVKLLSLEEAKEKLEKLKEEDLDDPKFVFRHLLGLVEVDSNNHSDSVHKENIIIMKELVANIIRVGLKTGKKALMPENRNSLLSILEKLHEKLEAKLFNLSDYKGTLVTWLRIYKIYLDAVCKVDIGNGKRSLAKFGRIKLNLDEQKEKAQKSISKINKIMELHGLFKEQPLPPDQSVAASPSYAQAQFNAS